MQQDYLQVGTYYDDFISMSCSKIEYAAANQGALSMLCSKRIRDTDFREYNTFVVPYCTQDVFIGDSSGFVYEDGLTVNHVGAHNLLAVLRYMVRSIRGVDGCPNTLSLPRRVAFVG